MVVCSKSATLQLWGQSRCSNERVSFEIRPKGQMLRRFFNIASFPFEIQPREIRSWLNLKRNSFPRRFALTCRSWWHRRQKMSALFSQQMYYFSVTIQQSIQVWLVVLQLKLVLYFFFLFFPLLKSQSVEWPISVKIMLFSSSNQLLLPTLWKHVSIHRHFTGSTTGNNRKYEYWTKNLVIGVTGAMMNPLLAVVVNFGCLNSQGLFHIFQRLL